MFVYRLATAHTSHGRSNGYQTRSCTNISVLCSVQQSPPRKVLSFSCPAQSCPVLCPDALWTILLLCAFFLSSDSLQKKKKKGRPDVIVNNRLGTSQGVCITSFFFTPGPHTNYRTNSTTILQLSTSLYFRNRCHDSSILHNTTSTYKIICHDFRRRWPLVRILSPRLLKLDLEHTRRDTERTTPSIDIYIN